MGIRYSVNADFFKKWSQEMAYTLGYLYADGSLEDASYIRGKYIRVSSAERENIEKIRTWLGSKHTIVSQKSSYKNGKIGYLLRIGSHTMYDDLTRYGLHPNKSLSIRFPTIPKKYIGHFIRGYFDGDGCVRLATSRGVFNKLSSVFTCGSRKFLEELADIMCTHFGVRQHNVYNGHRSYMLSYSTGDSIKLFKVMYSNAKYPIYLKRKFDRYKEFFHIRPKRVDRKIKSILNSVE